VLRRPRDGTPCTNARNGKRRAGFRTGPWHDRGGTGADATRKVGGAPLCARGGPGAVRRKKTGRFEEGAPAGRGGGASKRGRKRGRGATARRKKREGKRAKRSGGTRGANAQREERKSRRDGRRAGLGKRGWQRAADAKKVGGWRRAAAAKVQRRSLRGRGTERGKPVTARRGARGRAQRPRRPSVCRSPLTRARPAGPVVKNHSSRVRLRAKRRAGTAQFGFGRRGQENAGTQRLHSGRTTGGRSRSCAKGHRSPRTDHCAGVGKPHGRSAARGRDSSA